VASLDLVRANEVLPQLKPFDCSPGTHGPFTNESEGPIPATVVMIPLVSTFRITSLPWSEMYRFPCASNASATGNESCAATAGPPSPVQPVSSVQP